MSSEKLGPPPTEWKAPEKARPGRETRELSPEDLPPEPEKPKPPIEPGEEFSPEKEVKQIRQGSEEEQRKKLEEFKEKLAYQKEGLAKVQTQIIEKIREDPETPWSALTEWVRDLGAKYGINQEQKDTAAELLRLYTEKHAAVQDARQKYPDDADLYKAVFGAEPDGQIEVIEGPMTLLFRCFNMDDYTRIYRTKWIQPVQEINDADRGLANMSSGISITGVTPLIPELQGAVIAEKAVGKEGQPLDRWVFPHEEQHAINKLFGNKARERGAWKRFVKAAEGPERETALRAYLRQRREQKSDDRMRDEILAYFRNIAAPEFIVDTLLKSKDGGGLYDYLSSDKESLTEWYSKQFGEDRTSEIQEALVDVYEKEHKQLVKAGVKAFQDLMQGGYSIDKAIAVLIHEPLARWEKVVKRLTAGKKS